MYVCMEYVYIEFIVTLKLAPFMRLFIEDMKKGNYFKIFVLPIQIDPGGHIILFVTYQCVKYIRQCDSTIARH